MILLNALPVERGRNRAHQVLPPKYLNRLLPLEIEKEFLSAVLDWKVILVLDGVDMLDDPPSFRIRSHDQAGISCHFGREPSQPDAPRIADQLCLM